MDEHPIWKRLDDERDARGMTRADWARFLGVSPATYNNWREREVPTAAYEKLMAKTRWSFERLVKGADGVPAAQQEKEEYSAAFDMVFERLTPHGKELVFLLLKAVESCAVLQQDHGPLPAVPRGWIDAEDTKNGNRSRPKKPSSGRSVRRVA